MGSHSVRDAVLGRDGNQCTWCHTRGSKSNPLTMHHIVFKCQGGRYCEDNLQTLCRACHDELHRQNPGKLRKQHKGRRKNGRH